MVFLYRQYELTLCLAVDHLCFTGAKGTISFLQYSGTCISKDIVQQGLLRLWR